MDVKKEQKSGMLFYEDAEPIRVCKPDIIMEPVPRRGVVGRIKDRILGHVMKPCAAIVLTNEEQELLKAYMENPEKINGVVNACAVTAEDLKEATDRIVTIARGHHIRNADGTVTDVSNDPRYKCK